MKAVTFQGIKDMQVTEVEDAKIQKADDILVRITTTAICGSDLHIYRGSVPTTKGFINYLVQGITQGQIHIMIS